MHITAGTNLKNALVWGPSSSPCSMGNQISSCYLGIELQQVWGRGEQRTGNQVCCCYLGIELQQLWGKADT